MRKAINITALLFFIWLLLDAFNIPSILLNFLLVGALPGTTVTLSPTQMLAILTATTALVIFEILSRRVKAVRRFRRSLFTVFSRNEKTPTGNLERA